MTHGVARGRIGAVRDSRDAADSTAIGARWRDNDGKDTLEEQTALYHAEAAHLAVGLHMMR